MSDSKNIKPPVVRKPAHVDAPKNPAPQVRGGTAPVKDVKVVPPDQVKVPGRLKPGNAAATAPQPEAEADKK